MSYIGNPIVSTDFPVDYASGNGSTTAFTLSIAPASVNAVDVEVSGVSQSPQTYTISGTTLTFSAAPPSGTNNIVFKHRGVAGIPNTPSAGSVTTSSIAAGAVTPSKMANGGAEFGMRNRIINGAMVIDQRNAGASITANDNTYAVDRFVLYASQSSKLTAQQNQGSVTPPAGFTNYLGYTSSSAYTVGASEYFTLTQAIEGFNVADLGWGTANAKTVTLSFWVRSSLTGTFGGALRNGAASRCYPYSYTISAANTWEQKTITITGDTTGTWLSTNGYGLGVQFNLGAGASVSGTAGSWAGTFYCSSTGATSVVGTSGATFYITGVQLEVGSSATEFEYRQYGQELALCQRYYERWDNSAYINNAFCFSSAQGESIMRFAVTKRATPTLLNSGTFAFVGNFGSVSFTTALFDQPSTQSVLLYKNGISIGTNGQGCRLYNNSNAVIEISSEL